MPIRGLRNIAQILSLGLKQLDIVSGITSKMCLSAADGGCCRELQLLKMQRIRDCRVPVSSGASITQPLDSRTRELRGRQGQKDCTSWRIRMIAVRQCPVDMVGCRTHKSEQCACLKDLLKTTPANIPVVGGGISQGPTPS